jgi:hypothetical protein
MGRGTRAASSPGSRHRTGRIARFVAHTENTNRRKRRILNLRAEDRPIGCTNEVMDEGPVCRAEGIRPKRQKLA